MHQLQLTELKNISSLPKPSDLGSISSQTLGSITCSSRRQSQNALQHEKNPPELAD